MLKALELFGFKSFAEKTRFEFPRGITVVVGPNGSGKSNIVDAIKWVLGEQSVKSLRGKEMADVIFNGSSSRRPLNSAEITLTFENAERLLAVDTPEVHITRRVYRSGEGEYLINRQPCRLRDIRDLFSGTGIATEAYSVIEQGKVDALLQSSPRDRRVIFEEAAGISRFKAKKVESIRRLERVEQNLLRLQDIVDEVDNRLKTTRLQAAKARRYKEYADRLQELRTQVGAADWRVLTEQLTGIQHELDGLREEATRLAAGADADEASASQLEGAVGELDHAIRTLEEQLVENRERLAGVDSTIEHERARSRELEEQVTEQRQQLASIGASAGDVEAHLHEVAHSMQSAESRQKTIGARVADEERAVTMLTAELDRLRSENQQRRAAHVDALKAATALSSEISAHEAQVSAATGIKERCADRTAEIERAQTSIAAESRELESRGRQLHDESHLASSELAAAEQRMADTRRQLELRRRELAQLQPRLSGAVERASVLEELEKRLEGLNAGIKEAIQQAKSATQGPFTLVRGLLADLLHVEMEQAPLIEVALGERAQHLVVADGRRWLDFLGSEPYRFEGRVGFLPLDVTAGPSLADLSTLPGVLGRADRFVDTPPEFEPLVRRLLGQTWIVEGLAVAARLASAAGRGQSFVTLAGEHLTAEGTIVIGPRHAANGLISRRSELRALKLQIVELETQIEQLQSQAADLEAQIAQEEQRLTALVTRNRQAADALAAHRVLEAAAQQRLAQLAQQQAALTAEAEAAEKQFATAAALLEQARARFQQIESQTSALERGLGEAAVRIEQVGASLRHSQRQATDAKVELAKSEQQIENLRGQWRRYEEDQQQRLHAIFQSRQQLAQSTERARQAEAHILAASAEMSALFLRKETLHAEISALIAQREAAKNERLAAVQEAQRMRGRLRKIEEKLHKKELAAGEVRHERQTLTDRLRDDYGIELADLAHEPTAEEQRQRDEVDQEIGELRRKLTNIGSVNLDALDEVEELEKRFAALSGQFTDLSDAKASLEQIIHKIDADSRRLFTETLDAVKLHFQSLFRKLFGGGQADIVLDENVDVLESGIEIVARPPGKEPRSISLLSGGEKTMTCVALLLAIFRSRPSPFCVLDEVDAALDEANIERFVAVLKDFLKWTQFIVVTHSKKTMTCANTLHGVTMQESGVSKRVSVRFEDVSEGGEIRESAASGKDETQAA